MFESSVGEVAVADVAALAAALLGLSAGEVLGGDLASAQAVVAAAQRVLNAVNGGAGAGDRGVGPAHG